MIDIKRVLAPTDFSSHSEKAVRFACSMAERFEAELHLVHVLSEIIPAGPDPLLMPVMPPQFYEESEQRAKETLEHLLQPCLGETGLRDHGGAVGQPGRGHRRLLQGTRDRPARHRHPRPDGAVPRPPGLRRRADRPRSALPRIDHPRLPQGCLDRQLTEERPHRVANPHCRPSAASSIEA